MHTQHQLNWDHLRIFLAVMRSGSLRQAAQRLGLSHPTLRRRLEALESELGLQLFDRRHDGLHPTPEASELLALAEQVESSVHAISRRACGVDEQMEGEILVTAPDLVINELLVSDLVAFAKKWPQIKLCVETSYKLADLGSREADVAFRIIRHGHSVDGALVGRKAATMYSSVYGFGEQWIGWWDEEHHREWIKQYDFPEYPSSCKINDIFLQRAACIEGMGLCVLPCFMGDPWLEQRTPPIPSADIWVLVHPDLRHQPRLRLFRDEMVAALKRQQPELAGEKPFAG